MHSLVAAEQSAFIKNRGTMESIISALEIMWWCKNSNFYAFVFWISKRPLTLLNGISCWIS